MYSAEKDKLRAELMSGVWENLIDTFGRHNKAADANKNFSVPKWIIGGRKKKFSIEIEKKIKWIERTHKKLKEKHRSTSKVKNWKF